MGYYSNLSIGGTVGQEADPFRPLDVVEPLPAPAAPPLTPAERDAWNNDFQDGRRKFWMGYSLIYCANAGERAGYYDAAEESAEVERRMDKWIANRETLAGAW